MIKLSMILIASSIILNANFDNKPRTITKEDLQTMKQFEKLAYNMAENENASHVDISRVYNFIWRNRVHADDYTRLKIDGIGTLGYRTPKGGDDNTALISEENYNYYKVGFALTYNLYDGKTSKDIQNKKLEYRTKLLTIVEKYATAKEVLHKLKSELDFKRLEQIRSKVLVKTAQKYLDDRIKIIKEILDLNNKIKEKKINLSSLHLQLLNLVSANKINELKELL